MALPAHPEDVKATIRKAFGSVLEFERAAGLTPRSVTEVLLGRPNRAAEDAVSKYWRAIQFRERALARRAAFPSHFGEDYPPLEFLDFEAAAARTAAERASIVDRQVKQSAQDVRIVVEMKRQGHFSLIDCCRRLIAKALNYGKTDTRQAGIGGGNCRDQKVQQRIELRLDHGQSAFDIRIHLPNPRSDETASMADMRAESINCQEAQ